MVETTITSEVVVDHDMVIVTGIETATEKGMVGTADVVEDLETEMGATTTEVVADTVQVDMVTAEVVEAEAGEAVAVVDGADDDTSILDVCLCSQSFSFAAFIYLIQCQLFTLSHPTSE